MYFFKYIIFYVVLTRSFILSLNEEKQTSNISNGNRTSMNKDEGEQNTRKNSNDIGWKYLIPFSDKINKFINISALCKKSIQIFSKSYERGEEWAVRMADSSGKFGSGLLFGSDWLSGDPSQCIRVKTPVENTLPVPKDNVIYFGKYCHGDFAMKLRKYDLTPFYSFDICIPSLCDTKDLREVLNVYSRIPIENVCCDSDKRSIEFAEWICLGFYGLLLFFLLISTVIDIFLTRLNIKCNCQEKYISLQCLLSFSAYSNIKGLFKTEFEKHIHFLCGIKVLCTFWIIIGHEIIFAWLFMRNSRVLSSFMSEKNNNFLTLSALSGYFGILTFFYLSGLMTINSRFLLQNKLSYYLKYLIFRFLRFTPAMISTVSISIMYPLFLNKCSAFTVSSIRCRNFWWKNFIFINNYFITSGSACASFTWFISCLMQYTVLTVFMGIIFRKHKKLWILCNAVLIFVGILWRLISNLIEDLGEMFSTLNNMQFASYFSPESYLTPYFAGILFGYFLPKMKNMKFSKIRTAYLWCISFSLLSMAVYLPYGYTDYHRPSKLLYISYNTLHQIVWIIGISLCCLLCFTGHGGKINAFLSAKLFIILDRLSFQMYLLHLYIIYYYYSEIKSPIYFDIRQAMFLFVSILTITILFSLVFYLCFEVPSNFLISLLFPRDSNVQKDKKS